MIRFLCPACGKELKLRDEQSGKQGRCPRCSKPLVVPATRQSVRDAEKATLPPFLRVAWGLVGVVAVGAVLFIVVLSSGEKRGRPEPQNVEARHRNNKPQVQVKVETAKPAKPALTDVGDYYVETDRSAEITVLQITFRALPASTDVASKIVRQAVENAVAKDGSREILAMAFDNAGDALPHEKYGGPLTYHPNDKSIVTMDQRRGVKVTTNNHADYFCKTEEDKTYEGIVPARKWLTCQLVFADAPSGEKFKQAALAEIEKLKDRQLDISVYAYVGDKANSITWQQTKAENGKYMNVEYDSKSGNSTTNW